jgi:hypothetical protein
MVDGEERITATKEMRGFPNALVIIISSSWFNGDCPHPIQHPFLYQQSSMGEGSRGQIGLDWRRTNAILLLDADFNPLCRIKELCVCHRRILTGNLHLHFPQVGCQRVIPFNTRHTPSLTRPLPSPSDRELLIC